MIFEMNGVVYKRFPKVEIPKKDGSGVFAIRNFVIKVTEKWQERDFDNYYQFQLKNPQDLDNVREGDEVNVGFVIQSNGKQDESRAHEGTAFEASLWTRLKAIRIQVTESHNQESSPAPSTVSMNQDLDPDDQLPF